MFKKCAKCGTENFANAKYCMSCETAFGDKTFNPENPYDRADVIIPVPKQKDPTVNVKPALVDPQSLDSPSSGKPTPLARKTSQKTAVIATDEEIEDEVVAEVEMANVMLNMLEQEGALTKNRGVRFENAVGTMKDGSERVRRQAPKGRKSGLAILKEEGSNPEKGKRRSREDSDEI